MKQLGQLVVVGSLLVTPTAAWTQDSNRSAPVAPDAVMVANLLGQQPYASDCQRASVLELLGTASFDGDVVAVAASEPRAEELLGALAFDAQPALHGPAAHEVAPVAIAGMPSSTQN